MRKQEVLEFLWDGLNGPYWQRIWEICISAKCCLSLSSYCMFQWQYSQGGYTWHKKSLLLRHHLIHLSGQICYNEWMQWKTWLHGFVDAHVFSLWFPLLARLSCWGPLEYSWQCQPVQKDSSVLVHRGGLCDWVVKGQEVVREVEVSQDQLSGSAEPKRHTVMGRAPLSLFWFWLVLCCRLFSVPQRFTRTDQKTTAK